MIRSEDLCKYKTDEERLSILHEVSYHDWCYVAEWSEEARTADMQRIFKSAASSMYHKEEAMTYGEL